MASRSKIRFYNPLKSLDASKKIILLVSIALVAVASTALVALNNHFNELGWSTSRWFYLSYLTLLGISLFVFLNHKSLRKINRLPILILLILVFAGSTYASADVYRESLNLSQSSEITNEPDAYVEPDNEPLLEANQNQESQAVDTNPPDAQNQTHNAPAESDDVWFDAYEKRRKTEEAKYAEMERCNNASRAAGDKYSASIDNARAAYDEVMAEWDKVKDLPYYQRHPYEQYAADAKSKHNAISEPAYATYVSTLEALRSEGCDIIQTHSDYSR